MINLFLIPTTSNENDYLKNLMNGLEHHGVSILSKYYKNKLVTFFASILFSVFYKNYVVHFNWIENKVSKDNLISKINFIIIWIWISLIKLTGGKICWTMHNKKPHNGGENVESFYHFLFKNCDMIMVHCSESIKILKSYKYKGDIMYVPHGNYITKNKIDTNKMVKYSFLHFGLISKYKNIPILIKAFSDINVKFPNARLRILGECKDNELNEEIKNLVLKNNSIIYENRFLSDDELQKELTLCSAVILPYDKSSMLNSGSAIMAFSYGRPVIVPEFGYINDIKENKFVFNYTYSSDKEHENVLRDKIEHICVIQHANFDEYKAISNESYVFSKEELDWSRVTKKLYDGYCNLFECGEK